MSTTEEIEQAIMNLNGPDFQRFADDYVQMKYKFKSFNNLGLKEGAPKTTTGKPDSCGVRTDGQVMYFMYGAHERGVKAKIQDDLSSIKEELEEHPEIEVVSVNTINRFTPEDVRKFKEFLSPNSLTLIGISDLAQNLRLNINMHHLIEERLGLSEPTNQVMSIKDFIDRNERVKTAPTLNNTWINLDHRFEELGQALNETDVTVVLGNPGIGKTRTVLEYLKHLDISTNQVIVVKTSGRPVVKDIKRFLEYGKTNYIFLDDVTNVTDYQDVMQIVETSDALDIKIIGTLRTYLKDELIQQRISQNIKWIYFEKLKNETINEVVEGFGVEISEETKELVVTRSKGNPRVVSIIMTMLKRGMNPTRESVFLDYYKQIVLEGDISRDQLKVLAILHIQKAFNLQNITDDDLKIFDTFDISESTVKKKIEELNQLEFVNIFNNKYVNVEDQSFGDYAVYSLYQSVDFKKISKNQIIRVVQSIIIFGDYRTNQDMVRKLENKYRDITDGGDKLDYLLSFGNDMPRETFAYAANWVERLTESDVAVADIVKDNKNNVNTRFRESELIVSLLKNSDFSNYAFDLLLKMLRLNGTPAFDAFAILKGSFDFSVENSHLQFDNLNLLVEKWDEVELPQKLKSSLIQEYLKLHKSKAYFTTGKTFKVFDFRIDDSLLPIVASTRGKLIEKLADTGDLLCWLIYNIGHAFRMDDSEDIAKFDMDAALKYDGSYDSLISGYLAEISAKYRATTDENQIAGHLLFQIFNFHGYYPDISEEELEYVKSLVAKVDSLSDVLTTIMRHMPDEYKKDLFSGWMNLAQAFADDALEAWITTYLDFESGEKLIASNMFSNLTLNQSIRLVNGSNEKNKSNWLLELALTKAQAQEASQIIEDNILLVKDEIITRIGFGRLHTLISHQSMEKIISRLTDSDKRARFFFSYGGRKLNVDNLTDYLNLDELQNLYLLSIKRNYLFDDDVLSKLFFTDEAAEKLYVAGFSSVINSETQVIERAVALDKSGKILLQTLKDILTNRATMNDLYSLQYGGKIGERLQVKFLDVIHLMNLPMDEEVFYFVVNLLFNNADMEIKQKMVKTLSEVDFEIINWSRIHFEKMSRSWSGSEVPLLQQELKDFESYIDQIDALENIKLFELLSEKVDAMRRDIERTIDREYEESLYD